MKTISKRLSIATAIIKTNSLRLTPFEALKRFVKLSDSLYTKRYITFSKTSWELTATQLATSKLIPWYALSLLGAMIITNYYFILLQQLLSYEKDIDISVTMCLSLKSVAKKRYVVRINNTFPNVGATDKESSNLMGVFLHGIVSAIITTPLGACGAIAVDRKLDPTYLWFRNLTIISSRLKLILQLIVIFPMVLHASILIFGFGVIGVNIILLILETLTPLEALKRYAKLSNLLCAQRITFNRALEPSITPAANLKLTTWYVLSLLCAMVGTSFCFILTQQLLSNKKDVDISMAMCLTLIMASAAAMLSTTVCCTYHSRADELLFVIRNLWNSRATSFQESSNMIGIFLHGLISTIILTPLGTSSAVFLDQTVDPTYILFRSVTIISGRWNVFFRVIVIFSVAIHTSLVIFGFGSWLTPEKLGLKGKSWKKEELSFIKMKQTVIPKLLGIFLKKKSICKAIGEVKNQNQTPSQKSYKKIFKNHSSMATAATTRKVKISKSYLSNIKVHKLGIIARAKKPAPNYKPTQQERIHAFCKKLLKKIRGKVVIKDDEPHVTADTSNFPGRHFFHSSNPCEVKYEDKVQKKDQFPKK
ncbi:hypothetical protein Fcan01_16529 [Folsomia candida]|uniref:Uncharacterized protein n=1 Tax=Folsomia candida TaxID=158441 RepID=A0A226DTU6_FOLCA|nr:hypothetical protein Fcan01_16529 [Folsomia candida]